MHIDNLKKIIYQDSKYNFVFTDFEYALTSNHHFNGDCISRHVFTGFLFLSPHHLCEVGIEINPDDKTWDAVLIVKLRAKWPMPISFEEHNSIYPNNRDIEQDFLYILNDSNTFHFSQEPTLPEVLENMEKYFSTLMKKQQITYEPHSFSDKIMEEITNNFDLNNSEIKSVIFNQKEKGIFHKKIASKLLPKNNLTHAVKKI